jgi:hypothetical protein
MRFSSDVQRRAVFANLNSFGSINKFSELPDWAKKYTEMPLSSVIQTKISNEVAPEPKNMNKAFGAANYDHRRFAITKYLKEHPEIRANPQVTADSITLINVLMNYAEENGFNSLDEIDWDNVRSGGTYNDLRASMGLARRIKFEQTRLSKASEMFGTTAGVGITDQLREVRYIVEDPQPRYFPSFTNSFYSRSGRPTTIGSVWEGEDYVHGPRLRQPEEFEFIKNVEPSPKFYHFKDAEKLPKSLPRGSKLVVGKLRKSGDWALQSTLVPIDSKLGKSLIGGKHL